VTPRKALIVLAVTVCVLTIGAVSQSMAPTLSTSDKVAISALEQQKQEAGKQYQAAQQQELAILREWQVAHPGWHVDEKSFQIVADQKPAAKPEVKK
jgi:hypothetical protein